MLNRFTLRAREVVRLAESEARRLNHEFVGSEHLLLGLLREGSGVGANILKNLGVTLGPARLEVQRLAPPGPKGAAGPSAPLAPEAVRVCEDAATEAGSLGHNYVGTEHLLLALVREPASAAARVMVNLGLTLDAVRSETLSLLRVSLYAAGDAWAAAGPPTEGGAAGLIIRQAAREAMELGSTDIVARHSLLAALKAPDPVVSTLLGRLGLTAEQAREIILSVPGQGGSPTT